MLDVRRLLCLFCKLKKEKPIPQANFLHNDDDDDDYAIENENKTIIRRKG